MASVPFGHVYVRHLADPVDETVRRLPDPRPCEAPSDQQHWWPPVMLDPDWVRAHHQQFDLMHLHFGFDGQSPELLRDLCDALDEHGKPLVFTLHDLRNPHHRDDALHWRQVSVLMDRATDVLTLTPGAAAEIHQRWDRHATVIAHPHVVDFDGMRRPRRVGGEFVLGLHLKSLRANMDALPVLDVLGRTAAGLPGCRVQVNVHTEVLDPESRHHDPGLARALRTGAESGRIDLQVHDFFSDEQLWHYLREEIDVSVLPYRFGTHSGWLEACHDLGATVIAPSCGFYREQRPCLIYGHDDDGLDVESLQEAVLTAWTERPRWRAAPEVRFDERRRIAAVHREVYERAVS